VLAGGVTGDERALLTLLVADAGRRRSRCGELSQAASGEALAAASFWRPAGVYITNSETG